MTRSSGLQRARQSSSYMPFLHLVRSPTNSFQLTLTKSNSAMQISHLACIFVSQATRFARSQRPITRGTCAQSQFAIAPQVCLVRAQTRLGLGLTPGNQFQLLFHHFHTVHWLLVPCLHDELKSCMSCNTWVSSTSPNALSDCGKWLRCQCCPRWGQDFC